MQELIKRLEKDKWHVSGVDIQEAINLIESQAASIEHYKSGLTSAIQDIEKYKALCDQMATVMTNAVEHRWPYLDDMRSLIEAERAMR